MVPLVARDDEPEEPGRHRDVDGGIEQVGALVARLVRPVVVVADHLDDLQEAPGRPGALGRVHARLAHRECAQVLEADQEEVDRDRAKEDQRIQTYDARAQFRDGLDESPDELPAATE
jgi:hypothetical protein